MGAGRWAQLTADCAPSTTGRQSSHPPRLRHPAERPARRCRPVRAAQGPDAQRPPQQRGLSLVCQAEGGGPGRLDGFRRLVGRISGVPEEDGADGEAGAAPPASPWADWSGVDEEWDAWSGSGPADLDDLDEVAELREEIIERRRARQGRRSTVRDEYLRPIVDFRGIYNRLNPDEGESEQRVFVEAITNQYESREALQYAGVLAAVPLVVGFVVSRLVAAPLWGYAERLDPAAFALSDAQKVEGAHEVHKEEVRLRLEAAVGQAPALTDDEMLAHLRRDAKQLEESFREGNKQALLNVVSDGAAATVFFIILLRNTSERAILFRTIGRVFTGLSDTAKAFMIILATDTLLGYHSEEGWTSALHLVSGHYGLAAPDEGIKLFVAAVPVLMDTIFKYWIFVGLNREDPAAAVTLRQMDRH